MAIDFDFKAIEDQLEEEGCLVKNPEIEDPWITIDKNTLTMTCGACPSQWEAETTDGKHVYVRYRFGHLMISVSESWDDMFSDPDQSFEAVVGDPYDGTISWRAVMTIADIKCV